MNTRFERERRELEQRHLRTVDQLENRVASLDVQNRDLLEVRQSIHILFIYKKKRFSYDGG